MICYITMPAVVTTLNPFVFLCVQIAKSFWKAWQDFEVRHGNEDTFREMLRIKRSIQAQFSTQVNFVSVQMLAAAAGQEATNKTGKVSEVCICVHVCNFEIDMLKFVLIQYRKCKSEKL